MAVTRRRAAEEHTPMPKAGAGAAPMVTMALQYFGACGVYMLAGPALILLNKQTLHDLNFPYPIILSASGVCFALVISRICYGLGLIKMTQPELVDSPKFRYGTAWPIGALSAATLALGNASYVYLSVATCQMLKAFTPAITLMMLFAFRIESPSLAEMACVLLITIGTIGTTQGEIALSPIGLALQLSANVAESVRIVLSQQLLADMRLPLLEMQYHVAPPQLICLVLSSALFELRDKADREAALSALVANPLTFAAGGALGLGLLVAGLLAVKIAGSVAVKLLGIARGAALVLFEAVRATNDSDRPSAMQACGYTTSLLGFLLYTWLRIRQQAPAAEVAAKKKRA